MEERIRRNSRCHNEIRRRAVLSPSARFAFVPTVRANFEAIKRGTGENGINVPKLRVN